MGYIIIISVYCNNPNFINFSSSFECCKYVYYNSILKFLLVEIYLINQSIIAFKISVQPVLGLKARCGTWRSCQPPLNWSAGSPFGLYAAWVFVNFSCLRSALRVGSVRTKRSTSTPRLQNSWSWLVADIRRGRILSRLKHWVKNEPRIKNTPFQYRPIKKWRTELRDFKVPFLAISILRNSALIG